MLDENRITYFAETDHRNVERFGIKAKDRSRHIYVIGKTGMGKTTLIKNLAIQDIQNGEGLAFIDPHGTDADKLLDYVPKERINDVVYFAPHDLANPIAFNVMEDVGPGKRHLVADGLVATFEKIWPDVWSARMEYILRNILLALLEYPGSTLLGVNRMLSDKEYRKRVVDNITDPAIRSFWVDEYAKYTDRYAQEAGPAIQNKIGQFTANPLIRNIIGQTKSTFDLRKMMDEKKILIANFSKGQMGEINSNLLGGMLITKMYLAAMSRSDIPGDKMRLFPAFNLFVDEFQSFANKTFANILSESRKYKLNLVLAHQYIAQMPEEVRDAIFGNVGTAITFRVGAFDAELLEKEFAPVFTQEDIVNLGFAQIYLRLMIDGVNSQPFSARTFPEIPKPSVSYKNEVMEHSRNVFARPRQRVEEEIISWYAPLTSLPNQISLQKTPIQKEGGTVFTTPPHESRNKKKKKKNRPFNIQGFPQTPAPISVSSLKDKHEPAPKHIEDLRKMLRDATGKEGISPTPPQKNQPQNLAPKETPKVVSTRDTREIPEDDLRKMLGLSDDHG